MREHPRLLSSRLARLALLVSTVAATSIANLELASAERGQDTAPWPRTGRYTGTVACVDCHRDEARAVRSGVHAAVVDSPATMGCETCHGPGFKHATDREHDAGLITYPPALDAEVQRDHCSRCHRPQVEGHGGDIPGLLDAGIGCTECHAVHQERAEVAFPGVHFATRTAA